MPTPRSVLVALALSAAVLAPAAAVVAEVSAAAPASATTCTNWYVSSKSTMWPPWQVRINLRGSNGTYRSVVMDSRDAYYVVVGSFWDRTCSGGGGSWSVLT